MLIPPPVIKSKLNLKKKETHLFSHMRVLTKPFKQNKSPANHVTIRQPFFIKYQVHDILIKPYINVIEAYVLVKI